MKIANISKILLMGIGNTVTVFAVTLFFSIPLGLLLSFMSMSKIKVIKAPVRVFVFIMRGTPLMLQLFFVCFGLPFLPYVGKYLVMDRFVAACVTFALNYAAYFCEIFRGGLLSVDAGQYEAAKVLGLTKWHVRTKIVIPQMIKIVLPAVSNESITLVKDTALITTIGVTETLHYAKSLVNSTASVLPYGVAAAFYLGMTFVLTKLFAYLERKYAF
jgi:polar amino acid transport system permease protein